MLILQKLFDSVKIEIKNSHTIDKLDHIRIKYLGKKGIFSNLIKDLKNFSLEERKKYFIIFNEIKKKTINQINKKKIELNKIILDKQIEKEKIDVSLPGRRIKNGVIHPINHTITYIKNFFSKLGFESISGFEIEDEYHNFDALNIPKDHPARNIHDTFWFDENRLLRTQTSSMQIRIMKKEKPPIRLIFPGKVYRNDYDSTHTPMFHQVEGLIVEKNINFSNLKWIIYNFLRNFFHKDIAIRFRPSYFPFTTPSAEVDVVTNNGKLLEVLGCGMVHPSVLKNVNIDSNFYSACAFGIGIERITMLRYGISDLRSFFENDIRFIKQFKHI
ncbi:phenylalanine--tRNA ligase subunit alpha [Buchnera aphidicola]|uniref:Phenylalanine--tRNA ligase alpha subunit n=1 Tax=Buchnera aphidicola subsp. Schizaphis graminum (strain Sg) TaxID=198804 RepID=SYFA_BUCAP|nr:phenylalanine--tRNA ligase subunit alpha [Buchnera aphidicola]P59056.1 RecName: Full=Phenylalanine--tRNA ligase alpha subunit; AltName: Full=Phenylalanyl-tRNA synthetase alpha subunit; Short=PheRS [Buchnera aphidicola str. Sg (Schizaphis graminum)]AAM67689.1 phenylalanyl-tRNA synthetase alpha chain [Buchnera aphidicola str. Sg (Schizaphis graminum)]AWI49813.1 phenylalanine--tRNA ligase subunit alpha [Buchnera aphidicola (Schizaphis graminum)]